MYQSLSQVSVKEGDEVKQNDVIGASGKNLYGAESGNHVHFEIRMEGLALNPLSFIDKPVSSIEKAAQEVTEEAKEPAQPKADEKTKEPAADDKAKEPAEEKSEDKSDEKGNPLIKKSLQIPLKTAVSQKKQNNLNVMSDPLCR